MILSQSNQASLKLVDVFNIIRVNIFDTGFFMRIQFKVGRIFGLACFTGELSISELMQMANFAAGGEVQINFRLGIGIILDTVSVLTNGGRKFLTADSECDGVLALT